MTVQGVPEGVNPPLVRALSPSSLHVSWSEPSHPGGIIQRYHLNQTGVGTIFTHKNGPRDYTVTGKILRLLNVSVFLYVFTSLYHSLILLSISPLYSLLSPLCDPFLDTPDILPSTPFLCPFSSSYIPLCSSHLPVPLIFSLSHPLFFSLYQAFIYVCWFPENLTEFTPDSCHALAQPLTETQTHTQTQKKQKHSR